MSEHDSRDIVLSKAVLKAGENLGLSCLEITKIIGCNVDILESYGVNPGSTEGQKALILIRIYEGLFALVGDDTSQINHWMHSKIKSLNGIPADLVSEPHGLERIIGYIDTIKSKI